MNARPAGVRVRGPSHWLRPGLCCLIMTVPCPTWALNGTVEVGYRAEYTDNSDRTSVDPLSEWIQIPNAFVAIDQDGPNVTVGGAYNFSRRFYQKNDRDEEPDHRGSLNLTWRVLPNRLDFEVQNTTTMNTIDSGRSNSPQNQQLINTFSAGPTVKWRGFRAGDQTRLNYRYVDTYYDRTDSDSVRQVVSLDYIIPLSENRSFTTIAEYSDIDFDNSFSPDYTYYSGQLGYASSGDDFDLSLFGGYKYIDQSQGRDNVDGFTANTSLTWKPSAVSSLALSFVRDADDRSTDNESGIPGFGEENNDGTALNELFVYHDFNLTYSRAMGRTDLTLGGFYRERNYEDDIGRDEERIGGSVMLNRQLTRNVSARIRGSGERIDYVDEDRTDDLYRFDFEVNWKAGRRLGFTLGTIYEDRQSDDIGSDYDEWRGYVSVNYLVLGNRR